METDTRFLVLDDGDVIFSANSGQSFSLHRFDGEHTHKLDSFKYQRFPFLFDGKITALQDKDGNEKWRASDELFENFFPESNKVRSVFSFRNGNLVVVQMRDDPTLYLLDLQNEERSILLPRVNQLHHVEFSEEGNYFVINADDQLLFIEKEGDIFRSLFRNSDGHKLNPFLFNDLVYFASNEGGEFFKIYAINLKLPEADPILILDAGLDVKLPKRKGDDLFYMEVAAGEYFLKRKNLKTGEIESITKRGVVYDYSFSGNNQLIMVYTDFWVPKSLYIYDLANRSIYSVADNMLDLTIDYRYLPASEELSSAYEFQPPDASSLQGVILYFHPGLHSDFSPRWDPVLANLTNNGYRIIAPNYPMSFGFGKKFNKADFSEGKEDMIQWLHHLSKENKGIPIYTLAASSGNILMEHVVEENFGIVKATASLFGMPASERYIGRVPQIHILGENDPIVSFSESVKRIEYSGNKNVNWISYPNEGHWFIKSENTEHAVGSIIKFFCEKG
ncbi:alpha/beta hydrolase [Cyclobacterium sp. SYSU L10401]|uniref:alpha/beta hydrolase n=1 Tax=Cyclobacterium sp. SYSU L10401 TaxID=2678657 RepID=UPI0013D1487C|nr:hypothetical protein [Cyclobacterium sp. SYSU L10401]